MGFYQVILGFTGFYRVSPHRFEPICRMLLRFRRMVKENENNQKKNGRTERGNEEEEEEAEEEELKKKEEKKRRKWWRKCAVFLHLIRRGILGVVERLRCRRRGLLIFWDKAPGNSHLNNWDNLLFVFFFFLLFGTPLSTLLSLSLSLSLSPFGFFASSLFFGQFRSSPRWSIVDRFFFFQQVIADRSTHNRLPPTHTHTLHTLHTLHTVHTHTHTRTRASTALFLLMSSSACSFRRSFSVSFILQKKKMKKENSVGAGPEGAGLGSRTNFQVRWKLQKKKITQK